jgi:hypothetical protein
MFRKITFWLSGGRSTETKAGGSFGRVPHSRPDEKKRKKRSGMNRDNLDQETSTSNEQTGVTQEMVEVEIIQVNWNFLIIILKLCYNCSIWLVVTFNLEKWFTQNVINVLLHVWNVLQFADNYKLAKQILRRLAKKRVHNVQTIVSFAVFDRWEQMEPEVLYKYTILQFFFYLSIDMYI